MKSGIYTLRGYQDRDVLPDPVQCVPCHPTVIQPDSPKISFLIHQLTFLSSTYRCYNKINGLDCIPMLSGCTSMLITCPVANYSLSNALKVNYNYVNEHVYNTPNLVIQIGPFKSQSRHARIIKNYMFSKYQCCWNQQAFHS